MVVKVAQAIEGPSAETIRDFERYCRVKLPEDFVDFLDYGNGGIPVNNEFDHCGFVRLIERFLPMMADPNSNDIGQFDISVVMTQIDARLGDDPDEVGCKIIPFAYLFSGDFLCFDYRRDSSDPQVVIWDHNRSEEFSPHTEFVSGSFSELVALLARGN